MKLYELLEEQLVREPNFVTDSGKLKKWVVINKAQNFDAELIELLLNNKELKRKFFLGVKGTLVFNQNLFVQFMEQKNYLNDSYTQYKNKVGLAIDGNYLKQRNEVALIWPFKDCVLEGGQSREEDKREEIFFNETLAQDEITQLLEPKVLTNIKVFDRDGENAFRGFTRDGEFNIKRGLPENTITDNLMINGNNLMALSSLKKEFSGKIKLIYIEPPFNTERDSFQYNDSFTHSTWLTFMKNRLQIARELLSQDGTIYIHIDYKEIHYLKVLADSIFGRENFLNEIVWAYKERESSKRFYNKKHDTILFYAKNRDSNYTFNYDEIREEYSKVTIGKFKYVDDDGRKYRLRGKDGTSDPPEENENTYRQYLDQSSGPLPRDWFVLSFLNQAANERVFDTQKPEKLLKKFISASSNENDIVLDFFGGSGTTASVSHKLKRQWILCEQIESQVNLSRERLEKVVICDDEGISKDVNWQGGGSFHYLELKKYNQSFLEKIEAAKDSKTLFNIWKEMKEKSFLNYNVDIKNQEEHVEEFNILPFKEQKEHLCEILDKNQLFVNLSSLKDKEFGCTDEEMQATKDFYQLSE